MDKITLKVGTIDVDKHRLGDSLAMDPRAALIGGLGGPWGIYPRSDKELDEFKERLTHAWGPKAFDAFCAAGWIKVIRR